MTQMEYFKIAVIDEFEHNFFDVNGDTLVSELIGKRCHHEIICNGEILPSNSFLKDTIVTHNDELYIREKNAYESVDSNILIRCEELFEKFGSQNILVKSGQKIINTLFTAIIISKEDNNRLEVYENDTNVIKLFKTVIGVETSNWKAPHYFIVGPYNSQGDDALPPVHAHTLEMNKNFCEMSDLFNYDVMEEVTINFPEVTTFDINHLLVKHNCVVAGGYMLKYFSLIEDTGDIDILGIGLNFLIELYEIGKNLGNQVKVFFNDLGKCYSYKVYGLSDIIINYVQIIDDETSNITGDIIRYVRRNFDLSPCITAYDGKKIYRNSKLFLKKMDVIINGFRIYKYAKRGFKIRKYLGNNKENLYGSRDYMFNVFADPKRLSYDEHRSEEINLVKLCIRKDLVKKLTKHKHLLSMFVDGFFDQK